MISMAAILLRLLGFLIMGRARKNALIAWFWTWVINHLPEPGQRALISDIPKFDTFVVNLDEKPVACTLCYTKIYSRGELVGSGINENPRLSVALHFAQCTASTLYDQVLRHIKVTAAPDMMELWIFGEKLHSSGHVLKLRRAGNGFEYNVTINRKTNDAYSLAYKPALFDQIDLAPFIEQEQSAEPPAATTLAELEALMNS